MRCCAQVRVDQKLKTIATERHNANLVTLTSDELVAKEAHYHLSCYKVYTKLVKPLWRQNGTFKIDTLRSTIEELLASCEGHINFINNVKKTYLKKLEEGVETKNTTKNLRRSEERNCFDVQFLIVDNEEVICPNTITMEEILSLFFKKQKKMEQLKNAEENIYSSPVAIHKELEECNTYNTSWLPSCDELDMDCFPVSPSLQKFLSLVICNDAAPNNDKTKRITSSLSQELFYAVHRERN